MKFIVAVDGPAGTGKSSATKRIADVLGLVHVDTGALYRGIALLCSQAGFELNQEHELDPSLIPAIEKIAQKAKLEFKRDIKRNPSNRLLVNGKDVTQRIRTPELSLLASKVSAIPGVRSALTDL